MIATSSRLGAGAVRRLLRRGGEAQQASARRSPAPAAALPTGPAWRITPRPRGRAGPAPRRPGAGRSRGPRPRRRPAITGATSPAQRLGRREVLGAVVADPRGRDLEGQGLHPHAGDPRLASAARIAACRSGGKSGPIRSRTLVTPASAGSAGAPAPAPRSPPRRAPPPATWPRSRAPPQPSAAGPHRWRHPVRRRASRRRSATAARRRRARSTPACPGHPAAAPVPPARHPRGDRRAAGARRVCGAASGRAPRRLAGLPSAGAGVGVARRAAPRARRPRRRGCRPCGSSSRPSCRAADRASRPLARTLLSRARRSGPGTPQGE